MYSHLFSPFRINGVELQNRLTMAPLYLGYAAEGGAVSPLLLDHYRLMAQSGVALVVVENATIDHPAGSGSNRTLRADSDEYLEGAWPPWPGSSNKRAPGPVCRSTTPDVLPAWPPNRWPLPQWKLLAACPGP